MEDGELDDVDPCERDNWKIILIDLGIAAVVLTTLKLLLF
jgi:hypothetical protein